MTRQHVILGSGGHAKVLLDALRTLNLPVTACTDTNPQRVGDTLLGIPIQSEADLETMFPPESTLLVNGVGGVGDMSPRRSVYNRFRAMGYDFATIVHPHASVADDAALGQGVQVLAGAVVVTGARIDENTIINTRASVDHDCAIGAHCHIAPGVTLSGGVSVGNASLVGTGASVIQGISLGSQCIVGAGAAVIRNVPDGATAVGVPAVCK